MITDGPVDFGRLYNNFSLELKRIVHIDRNPQEVLEEMVIRNKLQIATLTDSVEENIVPVVRTDQLEVTYVGGRMVVKAKVRFREVITH